MKGTNHIQAKQQGQSRVEKPYMRFAGFLKGLPPDLSMRKGFSSKAVHETGFKPTSQRQPAPQDCSAAKCRRQENANLF
jgi:hypothetical protein